MSRHTDDENEILNELGNTVARHADWLDGPTRGYFDDLPSADDLVQALRKELGL